MDNGAAAQPVPAGAPLRRVTDPRALRALTHPVRLALLEELGLHGPLTATQVGERIGESPTTCSFHLRQLAKYGFVEEAGGGRGRARPWRMTSLGMTFSSDEADGEQALAVAALSRLLRERHLARYEAWRQAEGRFPAEWRRAASDSQFVFYVTAEEFAELNREVVDFLMPRYRDRLTDPTRRPPGARPVEMLLFSYPMLTRPDER